MNTYARHSIMEAARKLLQEKHVEDEELLNNTPARVADAWEEMLSGYALKVEDVLKAFDNDSEYDEMVLARNIEFYSTCEHHMLPFYGVAHVAYIPTAEGKIAGLSKLPRLVDIYARRFQVQERLTKQIVESLEKFLTPEGSACIIEASHMCVRCRGVRKQSSDMVTHALTGVFKSGAARNELMLAIHNGRQR